MSANPGISRARRSSTTTSSAWSRIRADLTACWSDRRALASLRHSGEPCCRWETDPEKAVIVALDWLNSFVADQVHVDYAAGGVHRGFHRSIESLWRDCDLLSTLQAATQGGKPLFLTGHSKGGALATLAALHCLRSE